jgi:hypothetical protein
VGDDNEESGCKNSDYKIGTACFNLFGSNGKSELINTIRFRIEKQVKFGVSHCLG